MATTQLVGYARVSSTDQDLTIQYEQLKAAGCERIFAERKTGTKIDERGELRDAMIYCREGDTFVVCRLDRFARNVRDMANLIHMLREKGVKFKCLQQDLGDLDSPTGRALLGFLAIFAEFETDLRKQRQREGIDQATKAGVYEAMFAKRREESERTTKILRGRIKNLIAESEEAGARYSVSEIARICEVHRCKIYAVYPEGPWKRNDELQNARSRAQDRARAEKANRQSMPFLMRERGSG